jgi:uncharacterized membrane protein (UPF0127 family)
MFKKVKFPEINPGLMFRTLGFDKNLYFDFSKYGKKRLQIHSFFCPRFWIFWVRNGRVLYGEKVKGFRFLSCKGRCDGFLEVVDNPKNQKLIKSLSTRGAKFKYR